MLITRDHLSSVFWRTFWTPENVSRDHVNICGKPLIHIFLCRQGNLKIFRQLSERISRSALRMIKAGENLYLIQMSFGIFKILQFTLKKIRNLPVNPRNIWAWPRAHLYQVRITFRFKSEATTIELKKMYSRSSSRGSILLCVLWIGVKSKTLKQCHFANCKLLSYAKRDSLNIRTEPWKWMMIVYNHTQTYSEANSEYLWAKPSELASVITKRATDFY